MIHRCTDFCGCNHDKIIDIIPNIRHTCGYILQVNKFGDTIEEYYKWLGRTILKNMMII